MSKIIEPWQIEKVLDLLNNKEFDSALLKIKELSIRFPNDERINKLFASIYFKTRDWKNSIKFSKKVLFDANEKNRDKIYTNIGVAYFNLGEIHESINAYKKSIRENSNSEITYNNLAISYIELGMYEDACQNLLKILNINKNSNFAQKNLIYLLNFIDPKNTKDHTILGLNSEIKKFINNFNNNDLNKINNIKKIIIESDLIIKRYYKNLIFNETQIYRKNANDLNCKRHFKVFNKFKVIPKFCFSCYKVQINLKNVVDLIRLHFIFDKINLKNNNTRKCVVELRDKVNGNYKGYVYCNNLIEAKEIKEKINKVIFNKKFNSFKIEIKHGRTEYYKTYPQFKKINFDGDQEFSYNKKWEEKENLIDEQEPIRSKINKKILLESIQGINLSDILIIKNWINYANLIGDISYKKIYDKKLEANFVNDALYNQLDFRKNDLNQ